MSAWVLAWSWTAHGISDGAHLLLCYLADQADDDGVVGLYRTVSRGSLAQLFDVDVKTVSRRIKELESGGWMDVERRYQQGPSGGVISAPNVYRLRSPERPQKGSLGGVEVQGDNSVPLGEVLQGDSSGGGGAGAPGVGALVSEFPSNVPGGGGATVPTRGTAVVPLQKYPLPMPSTEEDGRECPPGDYLPVGDPQIPRRTASKRADWLLHYADDALLDETRSSALIAGAFDVNRWAQTATAHGVSDQKFLEEVALPLIRHEIAKRKKSGKGHINSWGVLTQDMRAALSRFVAPIEPLPLENRNGERFAFDARDHAGVVDGPQALRGGGGSSVDAAQRALARRAGRNS